MNTFNWLPRLILAVLLAFPSLAGRTAAPRARLATAYYVAPAGLDDNPGTLAQPFHTIQKCANVAQAGDTCYLRAGVYRETVTLPRSGADGAPITFAAYSGESAILSGTEPVTGWSAHDTSGGRAIYKASMPWSLASSSSSPAPIDNQVFVDGRMMSVARWPNAPVASLTRLKSAHKAQADSAANVGQYSATYLDSDLASIPAGRFNGGYINFGPGFNIIWTTCDVTTQTSAQVSFTCNADPRAWNNRSDMTAAGEMIAPSAGNFYYLWGKLEALDTPGEWHWQNNTLYLWAPDGASPAAHTVEARARRYAFDLGENSYITLDGLNLFAATVRLGDTNHHVALQNLDLRYTWHLDRLLPFYITNGSEGLTLNGSHNVIKDSFLAYTSGGMIALGGTENLAENNVIFDAGYSGTGVAVGGFVWPDHNPGGALKNIARNNTVAWTGRIGIQADAGLDIVYNDVYQTHHQISDLASIYGWGTDGNQAQIAYNLVHDNDGLEDEALKYWGGFGIYLDDDTYNYWIAHNIVWNTTSPGIFLYGTNGTVVGVPENTPSNRQVCHNTVDGMLAADAKTNYNGLPHNLIGTYYTNNISMGLDLKEGVGLTAQNNLAGDPGFIDRAGRDYRLRPESSAIDAGVALSGPCSAAPQDPLGAAPDLGALESGRLPFVAGAVLRQQDLAGLSATCIQTSDSQADCALSGLPAGRKLPAGFRLRIGGATPSTEQCTTRMDYAADLGTGSCRQVPTGGQSGTQSVAASLDGTAWTTIGSIDLGGLAVFSVTPDRGPEDGGQRVTLHGRRFNVAPAPYRLPVTLNNSRSQGLFAYPVPVVFDSAAWIAQGLMRPDCGDLRFRDAYGELAYWLEEGCNTAATRAWVKVTAIPPGSSSIDLWFGDLTQTSASRPTDVFLFFDDFLDGVLSSPWYAGPKDGIGVAESGGALRIWGTTSSANQYTPYGGWLETWKMALPQDFAIDSELSVIQGSNSFKAATFGPLSLYGTPTGSPPLKRVGYWNGSAWVQAGQSSQGSATPQRLKISQGLTGPATTRQARWLENGDRATVLATYIFSDDDWGVFSYSPDGVATFDARFDNVRIRPYAFPEPQVSLGVVQVAAPSITFDGLACASVAAIDAATATCTTPAHAVGTVGVALSNPAGGTASLPAAYTYLTVLRIYLPLAHR